MTPARPRRVARWPWGVVAVSKRTERSVAWWLPGRVLWWGWCDCGWQTWRRRRRPAATALANHQHLSPELRRVR